ncbi:MAG: hypothetical protein R6W67_12350 [Bacteroidales bacterium]
MKVNILKLIEFYDEYRPERASHVSAITTFLGVDLILGILRHYFEGEGFGCRITAPEPTALESRQRLDRWLVVSRDGKEIFYQTEVKNWSVYTSGVPRTLAPGMNARQLNDYACQMYRKQWDERTGSFTDPVNLGKVLLPMSVPEGFVEEVSLVRPLVCYWYPITNTSRLRLASHFFTLTTKEATYPEVDIFSASLYLRHLASQGITSIDAGSAKLSATLSLLKGLIQL